MTQITFVRCDQPALPQDFEWPEQTIAWWEQWRQSPLSEHFMSMDWDYLLDTAMIHAAYWSGDLSKAAELRIRVQQFGVTPMARAQLRIEFADADERDARRPASTPARDRLAPLVLLHGGVEEPSGTDG